MRFRHFWLCSLPLLIAHVGNAQSRGLDWASFLGAGGYESVSFPNGMTVTSGDDVIVCGWTTSQLFPVSAQSRAYAGGGDAFVTRFAADGKSLRWSLFLGGTGFDRANAVHFDEKANRIYVVGRTDSTDFPTTANALQVTHGGLHDMFLTILDPGTGKITYSTLLGGSGDDYANDLEVDAAGTVTLAGWSQSANFPTTSTAWSRSLNGSSDAIVARIRPASQGLNDLLYSTFIGGPGVDYAVHLETFIGFPVIAGTAGAGFPTTSNAWRGSYGGGPRDGFAVMLDPKQPAANQLLWSTYVGGSGDENVNGLAVDETGCITLAGFTQSANLPMPASAFQPRPSGAFDGFIVRLDWRRSGSAQLIWGTYLGGSFDDGVNSICLDSAGTVTVAGSVLSGDFPTTAGTFDSLYHGIGDAFVARLDPSRDGSSQLLYCSYLGGAGGYTYGYVVRSDRLGGAFIGGVTQTSSFPATAAAYDRYYNNLSDAFVARFNMMPAGVSRFGDTSATCGRPVHAGVTTMPASGNAAFATTCTGAPSSQPGLLLLSASANAGGLAIPGLGITLHVGFPVFPIGASSSARGAATSALPLVGVPKGIPFHVQYAWLTPSSCSKPLDASNALSIVVQ